MAFAFFRRRRKLVIFVMVFLMVSFLLTLGGGGDEIRAILDQVGVWFGARDPRLVGKSSVGKLYRQEYDAAAKDLDVFRNSWAAQYISQYIGTPTAIRQLDESGGDRSDATVVAWMLLVKEAQEAGLDVPATDAKAFIEKVIEVGKLPAYEAIMVDLANRHTGITETDLLRAISHRMSVERFYSTQLPQTPPLMSQQLATFRDLTEQVNLRVVTLEARAFADKAGQPTADEVSAMFDKYKDTAAGTAKEGNVYGFGYRYPNRVRLRTLWVDADAIRRVTMPEAKDVAAYHKANAAQFYREEEAPPSSQPATASSQPATKPAPLRVLMDFYEARPLVIELLRPDVAVKRVDEIVRRLTDSARRAAEANEADPLGKAYGEQRLSEKDCRDILNRELPAKAINGIRDVTLEAAMPKLAEAAQLAGVCFPWGQQGNLTISPSVLVRLTCPEGKTMTLGAALDEIAQQVLPKPAGGATSQPQTPKLQWAVFRGMGDPKAFEGQVLYCVDSNVGLKLAPLMMQTTELMSRQAISDDRVFQKCRTGRDDGDSLAALAFESFGKKDQGSAASQIGKSMYVGAGEDGLADRVLWQVSESSASHVPEALTDDIRPRVVADWQIQAVMEKVLPEMGKKLMDAAKGADLAQAAKTVGVGPAWETGLFSRLAPVFGGPPQDRMDVIPLESRIARMSQQNLEQATQVAQRGDIWPMMSILAEGPRKLLNQQIDGLIEAMADRAKNLPRTRESEAIQNQLAAAEQEALSNRDLKPLFRVATALLPNRSRLGGIEWRMLQATLGMYQAALSSASRWDMKSFAERTIPEGPAMHLLSRLKGPEAVKKFLDVAFAPPADIEASAADLDKPGPVVTMGFPGAALYVAFQRIGYRPPLGTEFTAADLTGKPTRAKISRWLESQREFEASRWWFNAKNVAERLKFERQ